MIIKYTTKRDRSGNRYTLRVNNQEKTFHRDYNDSWTYTDYITLSSKKEREKLINQLFLSGYTEI